MNILYLASSADWHVDLWVKYFTVKHNVYLFSDREDYLRQQPFKNVTVVSSPGLFGSTLNSIGSKSHKLHQLNKFLSVHKYARNIDDIIEKYDIDVVHAHTLYYGFLASFINKKTPVIFTPMGSSIIIHAQGNRLYRLMANKAFQRADLITNDSLVLQNSGYKVGASDVENHIVQNGVDSTIFYPHDNDLREKHEITPEEIVIFSPRAITPLYNIDIIIESIAQLVASGFKIKCMFSFAFGDDYFQKLNEQVDRLNLSEHIIWLGYLTYNDMAKYYNMADVVVSVPSSDSSPKSVYEAMFCRKKIVVSDLPWSYEILATEDCFLRVPVRDSIALSRAFEKLLNDESELYAENAYCVAHKYFDYEKNMKGMERLMVDVIKRENTHD